MTRKRKPIKPATISGWSSCFDKWLNPNLGELPLASINNQSVKPLVAKMNAAGLSAKTILNYVGLIKLVVASAVSEDGEELFPREWNHDFLDIPVVENQYQPSFSAETMSAIVEKADGQERVLYALLAGTGLRIGEALGLEVRHFSMDFRSVTIEQSCWAGKIQSPKTKNALRQIDISSSLAKLLKTFKDRQSGLVFQNRNGKPLSQTNVVRRSLHPILKEIGVEKTGFHAMRRFRATWLRKRRVPEDLIQYWLGHAKQSVTDSYSKLAEDLDFRTQTAEAIGTGFIVPDSLGPMGPRIVKEVEVEIAA